MRRRGEKKMSWVEKFGASESGKVSLSRPPKMLSSFSTLNNVRDRRREGGKKGRKKFGRGQKLWKKGKGKRLPKKKRAKNKQVLYCWYVYHFNIIIIYYIVYQPSSEMFFLLFFFRFFLTLSIVSSHFSHPRNIFISSVVDFFFRFCLSTPTTLRLSLCIFFTLVFVVVLL